ncbi:MAG TPA: putative ABC exporter domain-containing protein [Longimicrobiales bacterium]|nr:putative ABC exporter domain-containing protein [Longimicrobiales bacterium]
MIRHFAFLIGREAANRLRRQVRRLRSPRYALALLVGVGYFWMVFGGPGMGDSARGSGQGYLVAARYVGPLLLALYVSLTWLLGRRDALAYRPAEIHFFFPAPITRRDLLRYRLLRGQVPLAFTALFLTLATHAAPLPWWLRLPSLYVLLGTIQLHHMAAALVHASAEQQGLAGWRRNWIPLLLFGAAALSVLVALAGAMPELRAADGARAVLERLALLLEHPGVSVPLAPFRFVLAPLTAGSLTEWAIAIGLAILVLAAHYVWVLRSDVAFEEAAAESGMRQARALDALRTGGMGSYTRALARPEQKRTAGRAAFALRSSGAPEVAIVWKNLTFVLRNTTRALPLLLLIALGATAAILTAAGSTPDQVLRRIGFMLLALGVTAVVAGPVWIRNDLRMDLRFIELIRTLPLSPARLVGAEIAASALTLSIIQAALLAAGSGAVVLSGTLPIAATRLVLPALAVLVAVPAIAILGVTIQNTITLAFPAWVQLGAERPSGVEAMGQNILTLAGAAVLLALSLLPALLLGGLGAGVVALQWRAAAPYAGGLLALVAVYGEVLLALPLLGRLYARTDPGELGLTR